MSVVHHKHPRSQRKFGCQAPKRAKAIKFGRIWKGALPPVPLAADYLTKLTNWQMLGNDAAGDCVAVTWANFRRLVTSLLTTSGYYPTQDQVWQIYQTQNPGFDPNGGSRTGPGSRYDNGMDIQTLLEYLQTTGGPDGAKLVAFASVDYTNFAEVEAAIAIFGGVWVGITVASANQDQFDGNEPWDYIATSPVEGGHSILFGGYGNVPTDIAPQLKGNGKFVTWATPTSATDKFWQNQVSECWVCIWEENLGTTQFIANIDSTILATDYQEITGQALVLPPSPAPTPSPTPTPVPPVNPPAPTPTPPSPTPVSTGLITIDPDNHVITVPGSITPYSTPLSPVTFHPSQSTITVPNHWSVVGPNGPINNLATHHPESKP